MGGCAVVQYGDACWPVCSLTWAEKRKKKSDQGLTKLGNHAVKLPVLTSLTLILFVCRALGVNYQNGDFQGS